MALRPAKASCDKFLQFQDQDKLGGGFADICTCVWRPGLVHRSGQPATPCMCPSAHQEPGTPLAGWFGTPPAASATTATPRSTLAVNHQSESVGSSSMQSRKVLAEHNGKSARKGRTSNKLPAKPARQLGVDTTSDRRPTPRSSDHASLHRDVAFKHRRQAGEYINEYRDKHTLRLVGRDGSPVVGDGDAGFGKNLPNPYLFKSENFRKMYRRLEEYLKTRPKPPSDTLPLAIERSYDNDDVSPSETIPDMEPPAPAFKISDKMQTNFADVFSPTFRKPKDLTFQPYINGSSASPAPVKLRYSHSAKRPGTFPSIGQDSAAVKFPMPAYVVTDSGNLRRGVDEGGAPGTPSRVDTVVRLLEPKTSEDNGNRNARSFRTHGNGSKSTPSVMTADFDAAMIRFLQTAKQNLERVREQRVRKEAINKSRLVTRGGSRSDLVVTSGKARTMRSSAAAADVRRINLGVSQS